MQNRHRPRFHRWHWMSLLIAGALVLSACASSGDDTTTTAADAGAGDTTTTAAAVEETTTTTEAAPEVEAITLEVEASNPEYLNAESQIWDIFEAQNPGVTVNQFAVNEDQKDAYQARRAGGYFPALEAEGTGPVTAINKDTFVDLLTVDTEWLDRWTYDVRTAQSERLGFPGLYSLSIKSGFKFSWVYNLDLMEELGLDPRATVVDQASLMAFMKEGQALVDARDDIDYFWDTGWHGWVWSSNYFGMLPLAYPDGQRVPYQQDSWQGKIADPAEDPFRYTFQWIKDAYDAGLMPDEFWLREWETDMEASYIAGKSVMMLHGPWIWDKMLAEVPDARQQGIPSTPPVNEGDPWVQFVGPLAVDKGYKIPIENLDTPQWDMVLKAYNFWNSPDIVLLRAQIQGITVTYELDEPLVLEGPQFQGIVKEFEPGGLYEDVILVTDPAGEEVVAPFKNEDAGRFRDWQWTDTFRDVMNDDMTVDEALAWFHEQVATDYTLP